jgi:hypothetical protein
MKKHLHWHTRSFDKFLREREMMPFAWGTNDCCIFAADAILANTGVDIADDFRGKYSTQLGAFKTIREVTGGISPADAAAHCAAKHGLIELKHPLNAKRGDLVLIEKAGALIAGVIHLNGYHVISVSDTGLVRLPVIDPTGKPNVVRAWSV